MNNIAGDDSFFNLNKRRVLVNGVIFVVFFLAFTALLWTYDGYNFTPDGWERLKGKYFYNYIEMWWCIVLWLIGVVMVLYGVLKSAFAKHYTKGYMVVGHRYGACGAHPFLGGRIQQLRLLSFAHRPGKLADNQQQLVDRIHSHGNELRVDTCAVCPRLHLVCVVQNGP